MTKSDSGFFWQYNLHEGDSRLNFYEKFDRRKFGPGSICKEINNPGSNKTLFDEDLASCTKNALQGLITCLKNEASDISEMFCARRPGLEVYLTIVNYDISNEYFQKKLRKQWKMLSRNDKIFFGEEIFDDCRIFAKKFDTFDGEQFLMAFIWCRVSKLPERYQDVSANGEKLTKHGDRWGYQYKFKVYFVSQVFSQRRTVSYSNFF